MAKIFNIQRYCLDDGPGIRTTIFFKGCPLTCKWCHNPEGQKAGDEIAFYNQKCINCRVCENVCKKGAHDFNKNHIFIRSRCDCCMECVKVCPSGALLHIGEDISIEKLKKTILEDKLFYDFSGGGITFSGGEPACYLNELKEILLWCRKNNIHTAMETCGYFDLKKFHRIIDSLDLIIFDLKLLDNANHFKYTGVSNELIMKNLAVLAEKMKNLWIRIPVIPQINTNCEEIKKICLFIKSLKGYENLELVRFNELGIPKYRQIGRKYDFIRDKDDGGKIFFEVLKQYKNYLGKKVKNPLLNSDNEKKELYQ